MPNNGFVTYDEIITQTGAWIEALRVVRDNAEKLAGLDLKSYRQVLFIGCGSTYYLSLSAANLFQGMTGAATRALPSSEPLLFPKSVYTEEKMLLVAASRSGTTSETLRVVEDFKARQRGDVIVLTNHSDSSLYELGDISLAVDAGREMSVVQTRSFASMLVAAAAISAWLGQRNDCAQYEESLVTAGNRLIQDGLALAEAFGKNHEIRQVFFLGSGFCYGLACEASLKLKEMSQTVTEPFHFFEFRHGPISMVDPHTLVIGLVTQSAYEQEMAVIQNVRDAGAKTLTLGEAQTDIRFESGLPQNMQGVLYLPVLQLLAYYRAVGFGKNPDKPHNLTAVVKLDLG